MAPSSNWREVVDEVQALDAIYGTDFRVQALTRPGQGERVCTLAPSVADLMQMHDPDPGSSWSLDACITVDLALPPAGLSLHVEAESQPGASTSPADHARPSLQYLPPLDLHLVLHNAYPSPAPPRPVLEASWLPARAAAELVDALGELWRADLTAQPACYAWAEWLRENALDRMGAAIATLRLHVGDEEDAQTLLAHLLR